MLLVNIILPVFLIIVFGYLFAHFKLLPDEVSQHLTLYVFWVAAPAIVFEAISQYRLADIFVWQFWLAYPLCIGIVTIGTYFLFRRLYSTRHVVSVLAGFNASAKNTIMVGFPILLGIAGDKAAIPMTITVVVFSCIFIPILMFIFELNASGKFDARSPNPFVSAFLSTAKNPLVVAAMLGLIFSIFHLHVPIVFQNTFKILGGSVVPCALFAVGMTLRKAKLSGELRKSLFVTTINLIVCPAVAVVLAYIIKLPPFYAVALVIFSAVPTAKSMYIYASKYNFFVTETAEIIFLTTVLSVITIPVFIYISYLLWPSVFQHVSL